MTERTRDVFDFHTHTTLSDGIMAPAELLQHAMDNGYKAIAVTDHVDELSDIERILEVLVRECEQASKTMDIVAIPGVELTNLPLDLINDAAIKARQAGAQIVIVHGETIRNSKDLAPRGTNLAAVRSAHVDVLAHPGLLTEEEAKIARQNGIYIELSSRRGHSLTNGHVARMAVAAGASMVVNSDAHIPEELLTALLADHVARGAGLDAQHALQILQYNPRLLLGKLGRLPASLAVQ